MARKVLRYTVSDENRDKGKTFVVTEMPAAQAERWAIRAFLAMGKHGIDMPSGMMDAGMAGMAKNGLELICQLPFDEADVLLAEMFDCLQMSPDPRNPQVLRPLTEDDIEEVGTRLKLRIEIFKLHVDFFKADK